MRGGSRHGSQMGDGFGDHGIDLHVAAVHREALGARLPDADAHDGGDAGAGFVAVYRQVDRLLKTHIEAECAAGSHQIEHLLLMFGFKHAVASICMRCGRCLSRVGRPVDDFFNEVRKLEVHLLAIGQGQRVAFAAQLNCEVRVGNATFDFQAEGQGLALCLGAQEVVEGFGQADLGLEQGQGAVVEFVLAHAACPPPFGSNGAGAERCFSLGLDAMKAQPKSCARRRISKMREGLAAAGWTCRVAVVCIVLPRSVVESGREYQFLVAKCQPLVDFILLKQKCGLGSGKLVALET